MRCIPWSRANGEQVHRVPPPRALRAPDSRVAHAAAAHDPQTHAVPATYGREFSGVGAEIKQHPGGGPAGSTEDDLEVGRAQHGAPVAERGLGHLGRRLRIVEHVDEAATLPIRRGLDRQEISTVGARSSRSAGPVTTPGASSSGAWISSGTRRLVMERASMACASMLQRIPLRERRPPR